MKRYVMLAIAVLTYRVRIRLAAMIPVSSQSSSPPDDPVVITNFRAEFVVDRDGRMEATETITGDFPGDRHGIFRYWDVIIPTIPGPQCPLRSPRCCSTANRCRIR